MKKAKTMVFVIGAATIISATLAFKVQINRSKIFSEHFVYTGQLGSGSCTTKLEGAAICNGNASVAVSTIPLSVGCPDNFVCTIYDL